jgi:uncharacterized small protein (TIGR04563 family)
MARNILDLGFGDDTVVSTRKAPDGRKQSLYFPEGMLQEVKEQAARLDRSMSWVIQRAWKLAAQQVRDLPSMGDAHDEGTADTDISPEG